jgi:hypothetical protein
VSPKKSLEMPLKLSGVETGESGGGGSGDGGDGGGF